MRIDVLTIFPGMFDAVLGESIVKRAQAKKKLTIVLHDLRKWTFDSHRSVDDKPFGGGPGMVMKVEPVYLALKELGCLRPAKRGTRVMLLTPQGKRLEQQTVKSFTKHKRLVLICGHYEGFDERIRELVDEEISVGDYVLTGGELPAMVVIDAVTRLLPGVLGHKDSAVSESFEDSLLEYPHYTRPAVFSGMKVPDVLLSGDHKRIGEWRSQQARARTKKRRPDLISVKRESCKL